MKILILGSDGQLGSELSSHLKNSSNELILSTIEDVDFKKIQVLDVYLKSFENLNLIINCAALTNTLYCEEHPGEACAINANPLENISRFCSERQIPLIHFSTDYVFDGKKTSPYEETDPPHPLNEYGKSKLLGEQKIQKSLDKHYIIRISSLYGHQVALGKNTNLIKSIITKASLGGELSFVSDQFITPTYTKDIARFILKLITNKMDLEFGIYHLSSEGFCSYYELANFIINTLKIENVTVNSVSMSDFPAKIKRPQNGTLSSEKISSYYRPAHWKKAVMEYLRLEGLC